MSNHFKPGQFVTARDQLTGASRYEMLLKIASGGMATVYIARVRGAAGFWRLVALKRLHAHLLEESGFRRMLISEARLASKIHHPHVVAVHDVEDLDGEIVLVMEYVEGPSLAALQAVAAERSEALSTAVAVRIILDACEGLHAAHELCDESGRALELVHRDVSPQNLLVGADGVSRLADFGIAKCSQPATGLGATTMGSLKGKAGYMAPEYVDSGRMDARGDIFALGVVAWEAVTGQRLFRRANDVESLKAVLSGEIPIPSTVAATPAPLLDPVLLKALMRSPEERYGTARAFAQDLERAAGDAGLLASHTEVSQAVHALVGQVLEERRDLIRQLTAGPLGADDVCERVTQPIVEGEGTASLSITLEPDADPSVSSSAHPSERAQVTTGTLSSGVTRPPAREATRPTEHTFRNATLILVSIAAVVGGGFGLQTLRTRGAASVASGTSVDSSTAQSSATAAPSATLSAEPSPGAAAVGSAPVATNPSLIRPIRIGNRSGANSSARAGPSSAPPTATAMAPTPRASQDKAPPNPYGP